MAELHMGRPLDWTLDPLDILVRYPANRPLILLHAGRYHPDWSRHSILAEPSEAWRMSTLDDRNKSIRIERIDATGHLVAVHQAADPLIALNDILQSDRSAMWIGYIGYDIARYIEKLPIQARDDRHWPLIEMHRCPGWLEYDHAIKRWQACGSLINQPEPIIESGDNHFAQFLAGEPVSATERRLYENSVSRAREYIAAGDIFQVNLAQRFTADFRGNSRHALYQLAKRYPATHGAYLELARRNDEETQRIIASNSPELFLRMTSDRQVITRPIKGTCSSLLPPQVLLNSEKDLAELNMIIDLLRNDLGRVCDYGSIHVNHMRDIEDHGVVYHGVATIEGRLHGSKSIIDLLRATMPGGSITGCPKLRAMQIIDELEPVRRGPYCGSIGYCHEGEMSLNIAIRTMLIEQTGNIGQIDFSVGGGIVADSTPTGEYEETLAKAHAIKTILNTVQIENFSAM